MGEIQSSYSAGRILPGKNRNDMEKQEDVDMNYTSISGHDLLSALSHEFRTPLNVILSTIQMAQLSANEPGNTGYKQVKDKYLTIMRQNCLRMLKLVNNLIDINRIDSDFFHIDLSNEDIKQIIEDITLSVKEYAQAKNIELSFISNKDKHIMACDTFQLERIILNLLSNAIKYTPEGGKIQVKLNASRGKVYISVSDSGPGIPEKYQASIFEQYRQTDGKSFMEKRGSGLGLFLVKKLLEKMKGRIRLFSREGQGSIFIFSLPDYRLPNTEPQKRKHDYINNRVEYLRIEFSDIYFS